MIPIDTQINEFFNICENNKRCIFSARFGEGKTYFLNNFKLQNKKKYCFITIHPVNYQIASNEVIFDYIKRDVLLQLLGSENYDEKFITDFNFDSLNTPQNLYENLVNLIPSINIGGVSVDISKVLTNLNTIKKKFENATTKIEDIIKSLNNDKEYELDIYARLNKHLISKIKKTKKVVLIIEDLDRIDPNHIFRLLNIFSAHLDCENCSNENYTKNSYKNKFNFDKIILVCDYNNIKNIYHHMYGEKTDFLGYISKFSTALPYEYSLKKGFQKYIISLIREQYERYPLCYDLLIEHIISNNNKDNIIANLRVISEQFANYTPSNKYIAVNIINFGKGSCPYKISLDCDIIKYFKLLKLFKYDTSIFLKIRHILNNINLKFINCKPEELEEKFKTEITRMINSLWLKRNEFLNDDYSFIIDDEGNLCLYKNGTKPYNNSTKLLELNYDLEEDNIFKNIDTVKCTYWGNRTVLNDLCISLASRIYDTYVLNEN